MPGSTAADRKELHVLGKEAHIHVVVGLDRPRRIETGIPIRKAGESWNVGSGEQIALGERVVVRELPVDQGSSDVVPLVGKSYGEWQTGGDATLVRANQPVVVVGVHADFERDVVQRSHCKGMG